MLDISATIVYNNQSKEGEIMKRMIFMLLALFLCLQPLAVAAEEAELTIAISQAEFCAGSTARLEVSISGNPGYSHITAEILYDASCLKLTKVEPVNAPGMFADNVEANRVAAAGVNNLEGDGVMFALYFDVLQQGEHTVSLNLEAFGDADGKMLQATVQPGSIRAQMHSYQDYTSEPTCTEDGIVGRKCDICGEVDETERIPALGHTFEKESDVVCKVCGQDTSAPEETVPATKPSQPGDAVDTTENGNTWLTVLVIVLIVLVLVLAVFVIVLLRRGKREDDNIPLPTFEDVDDIE